ncbi:peptide ABC transporter substrate-binding protein [bacterium]|nr:peptide ABC transporter substrate-binding protein [bacterium]
MKNKIQILFPLLFTLLFFACEKKLPPSEKKNRLRLVVHQDPLTLDSRKSADFVSGTFQYLLFQGLVRMTPDSVAAPAIAEEIEISEDGLTYTFHLRDARWSNGVPITAYDFCQTWKDMLDPNFPSPNAHLLYPIQNAEKAKRGLASPNEIGICAINHNTLKIYLAKPAPYFKELICFPVFSPVCQHYVQDKPNWAETEGNAFVCNGPYKIARRIPGREIVLEKNPYYWDADSVDLEEITFTIVDNDMVALNMFENNELDIIGLPFKGIPSDSIPDLLSKGLIKTTDLPGTTICCFNMDIYPFTNKNIRKAFAFAINRKEIVDNITQTGELPGEDLLPPSLLDNQPTPFFIDGDQKMAKKYLEKGLKELGITVNDLPKITLLHAATGVYPKVAQAIQEQWRKTLGISVELCMHEYKTFLDKLAKKDFCISQCVWIAQYHDPMNILDRFCIKDNSKNYPGYDNQEYTDIIEASTYIQDKKKRFELLRQALCILNEEVPVTAIYHWKSPYMKKNYVENLQFHDSGFVDLHTVQINQNLFHHPSL